MAINTEEVKDFFNSLAYKWDSYTPADDAIVREIFSNIGSLQNMTVLDGGCGTGFLVPYYIDSNVGDLDCIDISDEMIRVARSKYDYDNVSFICQNILEYEAEGRYDIIVIFNAFPHLPAGRNTFEHLASLLKEDGIMTIAHSMSRESLIRHHSGVDDTVSAALPELDEFENMTSGIFRIVKAVDTDRMFQIIFKKASK